MAKIVGIEGMTGADLQMELSSGGRFVIFPYCISIVVLTFRRGSSIHFVKAGESAVSKSLPFVLLSLILGWWGIPWGPIHTIGSVVTNLQGGKDVTTDVLASIQQASARQ
jgi:hypothetical protein